MNENRLGILGWVTFILLVVSGCYVAFRVPLITYHGIPEGIRLVLNLELVGLLIASTLEVISNIAKLADPGLEGTVKALKQRRRKRTVQGGLAGAS